MASFLTGFRAAGLAMALDGIEAHGQGTHLGHFHVPWEYPGGVVALRSAENFDFCRGLEFGLDGSRDSRRF